MKPLPLDCFHNVQIIKQPIDLYVAITKKERSSSYIQQATLFLKTHKGQDACDSVFANLGIKSGSSIHRHLMGNKSWNSYLLEVAFMIEWLKWFDNDPTVYTKLGAFMGNRNALISSIVRTMPLRMLLKRVKQSSNIMSIVSIARSRTMRNKKNRTQRTCLSWTYKRLPSEFKRPHLSSVYMLNGIVKTMLQTKFRNHPERYTFLERSTPLSPLDFNEIDNIKYYAGPKNSILDQNGNNITDSNPKYNINNIFYLRGHVSYWADYFQEDNFISRISQYRHRRKLAKDTKLDRAINRVHREYEIQTAKFTSELNVLHQELKLQNKEVEMGLKTGAAIQQGMMPKEIYPWNAISFSTTYLPLQMISGDFYEVIKAHDHLYIFVGDVSGHGIPAALLTMTAKQFLYNTSTADSTVDEIFFDMNAKLSGIIKTDDYLTCFGIKIDSLNQVSYCNAAHAHALYYSYKNDEIISLQTNGSLIGVFPKPIQDYESKSLLLHSGDKIFIYTDGITEYTNQSNEPFGEQRLLHIISEMKNNTLEEIHTKVKEELTMFSSSFSPQDDITLFSLQLDVKWHELTVLYKQAQQALKTDIDQSLSYLLEANKLIKNIPNVLFALAKLYTAKKQYKEACYYIDKVVTKKKKAEVFILAMKLYKIQGLYDKATEYALKLQSIDSANKQIAPFLASLKEKK